MGRVPPELSLAAVPDGHLAVSEVFGPTVQGEGPSAGQRAAFVRLAHCNLACGWCFARETPVLMADWTWRPIGAIRPGDAVLARTLPSSGRHGVLAVAEVTQATTRVAPLVRVNGEVTCTPDHPFWVAGNRNARSGWRSIERCLGLAVAFVAGPPAKHGVLYERGWIAGMAVGDGCFWNLRHRQRVYRRFRLALNDAGLLARFHVFAERQGFGLRPGVHSHEGFGGQSTMPCLWLTVDSEARRFERFVLEDVEDDDWAWGFVGGLLDAEGSLSHSVLRVAQSSAVNACVLHRLSRVLDALGLAYTLEAQGVYLHRSRGGCWRILSHAAPAKQSLLRGALGHAPNNTRVVESLVPAGVGEVVTLTTTVGSFIAAGFVVKNCDTAYTWDWERHDPAAEIHLQSVDDVTGALDAALGTSGGRIVVTGGEPLLQQRHLVSLLERCRERGWPVEVETNGTVAPTAEVVALVSQFNVSPKLANSGMPPERRLKPGALAALAATGKAIFKFVVADPGELDEVAEVVAAHGLGPVWIMPEGVEREVILERLRALADPVVARGWHLTPRLHILLWGDERGR